MTSNFPFCLKWLKSWLKHRTFRLKLWLKKSFRQTGRHHHSITGWKLQGYDTFARERYPLYGEFETEADAIAAAKLHLADLEWRQPTTFSGGQEGIQDHIHVIRPNGTPFRVEPSS